MQAHYRLQFRPATVPGSRAQPQALPPFVLYFHRHKHFFQKSNYITSFFRLAENDYPVRTPGNQSVFGS
jgi:hypothetical protein